jgi:hypothetical protein
MGFSFIEKINMKNLFFSIWLPNMQAFLIVGYIGSKIVNYWSDDEEFLFFLILKLRITY